MSLLMFIQLVKLLVFNYQKLKQLFIVIDLIPIVQVIIFLEFLDGVGSSITPNVMRRIIVID